MSINIKTMQFIKHEGSISTEATTEGTTPTPATNSEVVIALGTKSAGFDCYLTHAKVQEQTVEGEKVETEIETRTKAVAASIEATDESVQNCESVQDCADVVGIVDLADKIAAVRTALKNTNTVEGIEEFLAAYKPLRVIISKAQSTVDQQNVVIETVIDTLNNEMNSVQLNTWFHTVTSAMDVKPVVQHNYWSSVDNWTPALKGMTISKLQKFNALLNAPAVFIELNNSILPMSENEEDAVIDDTTAQKVADTFVVAAQMDDIAQIGNFIAAVKTLDASETTGDNKPVMDAVKALEESIKDNKPVDTKALVEALLTVKKSDLHQKLNTSLTAFETAVGTVDALKTVSTHVVTVMHAQERKEDMENLIRALKEEDKAQLELLDAQQNEGNVFVSALTVEEAEKKLTVSELKNALTTMDNAKKNEPAEMEAAQKKAEEERKAAQKKAEEERKAEEEKEAKKKALRKSAAPINDLTSNPFTIWERVKYNLAVLVGMETNGYLGALANLGKRQAAAREELEEMAEEEKKLAAEAAEEAAFRSNHPIGKHFYKKSVEMKNEEFRYMALSLPVGEFNTSKIECPTFTVDLSKLTATTNMVDGEVTTYTFDSLPSGAVTAKDWSLGAKIAVAASAIGVVGVIGLIAYKFFGSSKVDEAEEHLVV